MDLTLVSPPAQLALTMDEVVDHLNLWDIDADEERYLTALVMTAIDYLDGRHGILGRALVSQVWDYRTNPCLQLILPFPPIQEVLTMAGTAPDGTELTLNMDDFVVRTGAYEPYITPKIGQSWPAMQRDSLIIRFKAGYGDTASDIPASLKTAMKFLVAHWYENRAAVESCKKHELPMAVDCLLRNYRMSEWAAS